MIRAKVIRDEGGYCRIETVGHAKEDVCAAVTTVLNMVGFSFKWLAETYPKQFSYDEEVVRSWKEQAS